MVVYTSVTKSYIPKARVLAKSVKQFHANWKFILLLSDDLPKDFNISNEPFDEVLTVDNLQIPNWKSWAFGHALVELCTAVKGPAAALIANRGESDKIMYLDPDIKVYSSLEHLEILLDTHQILLTPHLLEAETDIQAIMDNEISALKHGVYNLGFFAARTSGQGLNFINWWSKRLQLFCEDNIPGGLFTDQRWCDLAPAFFSDLHIVRDPGFNVATWNIAHRPLSRNLNGTFNVAGVPLRFYHFTSYDNGNGLGMLQKYASNQKDAFDLWTDYGKDLANEGHGDPRFKGWMYADYVNGEVIPLAARRLYKKRQDLQKVFPDPYASEGLSFAAWWINEIKSGRISIDGCQSSSTRILQNLRSKIIQNFNSPQSAGRFIRRVFETIQREGLGGLYHRIRNL